VIDGVTDGVTDGVGVTGGVAVLDGVGVTVGDGVGEGIIMFCSPTNIMASPLTGSVKFREIVFPSIMVMSGYTSRSPILATATILLVLPLWATVQFLLGVF